MKFEPKTEKEVLNLWPDGIYDFEVVASGDEISKGGNEMMHLDVRVYDNSGHGKLITDYLVATDSTAYKIRHFAEATGMLAQYERGELDSSQVIGKTGRCKVRTDDKNPAYPAKNVIQDYVKANGAAGEARVPAGKELDDQIPF